jgi:hypothetical protein
VNRVGPGVAFVAAAILYGGGAGSSAAVPALATASWYAPLPVFLAWIVATEVSGSAE